MSKVYVSGPMTGYPDWNYPAFHAAAAALRADGHEVISPAEIDPAEYPNPDPNLIPWEWFLRRDIALLVTCDAIAPLAGWEGSRGARLEMHIAEQLGLAVIEGVSSGR